MKDIFEELKANSTTGESYDFVPYEGLNHFSTMLYTEILRRNQNDCSIDWAMIGDFKDLRKPNTLLKNRSEEIAVEILRCYMKSKGEKIVAIPISIKSKKKNMGQRDFHANVLLFNTKLMTAEHYEPHGAADYTDKYTELNLKTGIDRINQSISTLMRQWKDKGKLKVEQKTFKGRDVTTKGITITGTPPKQLSGYRTKLFKYMTPIEVCPSPQSFKDFIGWQNEYDTGKNTSIFEGVKITETGGYCSAWSMFILDMRLQQLDKPAPETTAEFGKYLKEFRDNLDRKEDFVILIRGYVKQVFQAVKKLVAEGKFSLKEFGLYYGYQQADTDKLTEEKSQELFGMSNKEAVVISNKVIKAMDQYSRDYLTNNVRKDYKTTTKSLF